MAVSVAWQSELRGGVVVESFLGGILRLNDA